jgi:hypothetical protein
MPKNPVTDPITNQEIAFAQLILSGTMNDRQAAEAVGLKPHAAAYLKSKPRVRAYLAEHSNAVKEKLVDQEVERLRNLPIGRDQILTRLWQLAGVDPEVTRGSMAGQIKALSMIVAIEGLIPNRRLPAHARPVQPQAFLSEPTRPEPRAEEAVETQPVTSHLPDPPPGPAEELPAPNSNRTHNRFDNPFIHPQQIDRVFDTLERSYDVNLNPVNLSLLIPPGIGALPRGR